MKSVAFLGGDELYRLLCSGEYRPVTSCAEVQMCVGVYADLIASMTIHQIENTGNGDRRVIDGLSRRVDIEPNADMTHMTFMGHIVRVLMLHGNQVTIPIYRDGLLEELRPVPPSQVQFLRDGNSYLIRCGGELFRPDEVLHFAVNPDPEEPFRGQGFTASLRDVVRSLQRTQEAKNAIMASPKPSVIVKVQGLTYEEQTPEKRDALVDKYVTSARDGRPWLIPAEAIDVQQIKPLTLNDLAIEASLNLDKRSVASILGVPAFMVGVGAFDAKEYDWFVSTRVRAIAKIIEQELTRKLLISPDRFWRMNQRSLLNYDTAAVIAAGSALVDHMAMRRNEWREWLGLGVDPEMEELLALENYIPASRLGDQKKLKDGGTDDA